MKEVGRRSEAEGGHGWSDGWDDIKWISIVKNESPWHHVGRLEHKERGRGEWISARWAGEEGKGNAK